VENPWLDPQARSFVGAVGLMQVMPFHAGAWGRPATSDLGGNAGASDVQTGGVDMVESSGVGKRGALVIPAKLRRRFGIEEGSEVIAEEAPEGILIRPAMTVPIEVYGDERKAEFLLSNAIDAEDYRRAQEEVRRMGLDPTKIEHERPAGA
jgi:AbrB family looped-hinge helix DNA binding protein